MTILDKAKQAAADAAQQIGTTASKAMQETAASQIGKVKDAVEGAVSDVTQRVGDKAGDLLDNLTEDAKPANADGDLQVSAIDETDQPSVPPVFAVIDESNPGAAGERFASPDLGVGLERDAIDPAIGERRDPPSGSGAALDAAEEDLHLTTIPTADRAIG